MVIDNYFIISLIFNIMINDFVFGPESEIERKRREEEEDREFEERMRKKEDERRRKEQEAWQREQQALQQLEGVSNEKIVKWLFNIFLKS